MKRFGLLGERLSHSYSPQIHSFLGDYNYLLYEKKEKEVADFVKSGAIDGFNVTVPYKKVLFTLCDFLSDTAKKIGAVNTVVCTDGKLYGYNTDYFGFKSMLLHNNISVKGKNCLVLGSGGASLTVRTVLADENADKIVVISRSGPDNYNNLEKHSDAEIIINTTPVGMFPDISSSPISLSGFPVCETVIDLIYNPYKTSILKEADSLGMKTCNGLYMLVAQAVKSAEIFTGKSFSEEKIEDILKSMEDIL